MLRNRAGKQYIYLCRRGHLGSLLAGLFNRADHVERLLRHVVAFAVEDFVESLDRIFDLTVLPCQTRELRADEERLREQTLDLTGTGDGQLVVFRQLVETENRDDILEVLVPLEDLLNRLGRVVVIFTNDG